MTVTDINKAAQTTETTTGLWESIFLPFGVNKTIAGLSREDILHIFYGITDSIIIDVYLRCFNLTF